MLDQVQRVAADAAHGPVAIKPESVCTPDLQADLALTH